MRSLTIRVKEILGSCDKHKVGDYFRIENGKLIIPEGVEHLCIYALSSLLPLIPAKERRIDEPDDWLPRVSEVHCPDPYGRVIWEIVYE